MHNTLPSFALSLPLSFFFLVGGGCPYYFFGLYFFSSFLSWLSFFFVWFLFSFTDSALYICLSVHLSISLLIYLSSTYYLIISLLIYQSISTHLSISLPICLPIYPLNHVCARVCSWCVCARNVRAWCLISFTFFSLMVLNRLGIFRLLLIRSNDIQSFLMILSHFFLV